MSKETANATIYKNGAKIKLRNRRVAFEIHDDGIYINLKRLQPKGVKDLQPFRFITNEVHGRVITDITIPLTHAAFYSLLAVMNEFVKSGGEIYPKKK